MPDLNPSLMLIVQLQWLARALFAAFLISVVAEALPLRIGDLSWRLSVMDTLVNNATIPLIGLGIAHLAAHLDPARSDAVALWRRVSNLAVLASLGFLLIVPIQIATSVSLYNDLSASRFREINRTDLRLINLASEIRKSTTVDQLESTLLTLQGSGLTDSDRTKPLTSLKEVLLNRIGEARKVLEARRRDQSLAAPLSPTLLIRRSLRVGLTSLVFCLAFAAAAKRPKSPFTLLESWQIRALGVQDRLAYMRARRRARKTVQLARRQQAKPWLQQPPPSDLEFLDMIRDEEQAGGPAAASDPLPSPPGHAPPPSPPGTN